jgi:hypothetical protein
MTESGDRKEKGVSTPPGTLFGCIRPPLREALEVEGTRGKIGVMDDQR